MVEHNPFHLKEVEEHEGEKYLKLLGLERIADYDIALPERTVKVRDFLEICGEHARPVLMGLELLEKDDPRRDPAIQYLRGMIGNYVNQGQGTVPPEINE